MSDKYLSRIPGGWQVRLPEISNGIVLRGTKETVNRCFYNTHYKNPKLAAKKWRNKILKQGGGEFLLKQMGNLDRAALISRTNTSGAIGVQYAIKVRESGYESEFYYAEWSVDKGGKRGTKRRQFSCGLYGEKQAFKLACEQRFIHKGVIIITDPASIPCYPDVTYLIR